jgi:hypothetical protein
MPALVAGKPKGECQFKLPSQTMSSRSKYVVAGFLLCLLVIALLLFCLLPGGRSLPFNTDAFVSTSRIPTLPTRPSLGQRAEHLLLVTEEHFFDHTPRAVSISAQSASKWGVEPLLNICTGYSSTRYLMSKDLAAGTVSFGTTNTMNGPQFISAIEDTVSRSNVTWLDSSHAWRTEPLALLRFPEAKTVVVLPKSEVADFLRTNGIDPKAIDGRL